MESYITCPKCGKTIMDNSVVDSVSKNENLGSATFVTCDCGERITYWAITAQLREQRTLGKRIRNWFQNLSKSQG